MSREDLTGYQWWQLTFFQAPTETVEVLAGLWMAVFGFWMLLPWWDVCALSPSVYRLLLLVLRDEWVIGALNFLQGFCLLYGLHRDDRALRFWGSVSFTSLTGVYTAAFLFSDYRSPAFLFWGLLCAAGWWMSGRNGERLEAQRKPRRRASAKETR